MLSHFLLSLPPPEVQHTSNALKTSSLFLTAIILHSFSPFLSPPFLSPPRPSSPSPLPFCLPPYNPARVLKIIPSTTERSRDHPTTIFVFHPRPPTLRISTMSSRGN